MPVTLGVGRITTPEFKVNLNRSYIIQVEAKKRFPVDVLSCMMGISDGMFSCDKPPLVSASWTLWSNHRIVAQGTSDDDTGGGWGNDTVDRAIGNFKGESGKKYVLDVNFTRDGTQLAIADPHLKVDVTAAFYEDITMEDLEVSALFVVVEISGTILLLFSARRHWRARHGGHPN